MRASRAAAAITIVCATLAAAGCAASSANMLTLPPETPFVLTEVTGVEPLGQVTGADAASATDKYAVHGTDLGSMFQHDGKTWFVFGDTFGERPPGFTGGGGSFWRSNTMGYTTDTDPSDGITLDGMILDEFGAAAELLPSKKVDNDEMTVIPTHGFAANGAMYLHWMSVRHWGDPGEWEVNDAGLAKSTDDGQSWKVLDEPRWDGESQFVQVSPAPISEGGTDWTYFWGITHGRFGGASVMKVETSELERQDAYHYFTGTDAEGRPKWGDSVDEAAIVVDDTVGELSVVWNEYLDRWIMTYLREGTGVVMREGITPWGPWGEPLDVVPAADLPGLYAPYMAPHYTDDGGKTIYFALSVWDPYNVFWYKAELSKD
ncbi:DUF4185 domain-containing protein [Lysobacter korlensis]|uniref:DUF4185 domain-containing protein n=1 Tax=Lysobacter korlensis TaxID=553636 RepID=A0ABV6RUC8_9GAMM